MATLSSAIVKQQVASMHDVEEALARQVLYGGDLATNLLETASISEARLTAVIAQCHGMAPAPAGQLPRPSPGTLRLVPAEIAIRHGIFPIGERPGELWVAVAEPIPAEVENDLSFALGVNLVQFGALLVRVREAIARDYGAPLERRLERLLDRLGGAQQRPSDAAQRGERRTASGTLGLPRPDTLPPKAYLPDPALPVTGRPAFDAGLLRGAAAAPPAAQAIVPAPVVNVTAGALPVEPAARTAPASGLAAAPGRSITPGSTPASARDLDASASQAAAADTSESISPPLRSDPPPPIPLTRLSGAPEASVATRPPGASPERAGAPPAVAEPPPTPAPTLSIPTGTTGGDPAAPPGSVRPAAQKPGSARPRPRRGPYTAAMAERDLQDASSRDEVLRACFDFCAQYFEYTALFAVQGDLAEGRDAQGPGADRAEITELSVPLDRPGLFATARRTGTWVLAPPSAEGVDAAVARGLRRTSGKPVMVIPVMIRDRCVLLLWGDHGAEGVELGAVGDVIAFVALTAAALERVILKRKRAVRRAVAIASALESMPQPLAGPERGSGGPPAGARASDLATALGAAARAAPPAAAAPALPEVTSAASAQDLHDALTPAAPPAVRASWTEPVAPLRLEARPTALAAGSAGDATAADPARRHPTARGVAPPTVEVTTSRRDTPAVPVETEELDQGWEVERGGGAQGRSAGAAANGSEAEVRSLVERLTHGDTSASVRLASLGEAAITALVAAMPGPITVDPRIVGREGVLPSRCGPVLEALVRCGPAAVPFLKVRSADADAAVRAWTVRLLGELGGMEAARAIARRVDDEDEGVRQAALAGARLLHHDAEARAEIRALLQATASDRQAAVASRLGALEALGRLRDPEAIPGLVALLEDPSEKVARSAQSALIALAFQDLGRDAEAWRRWWARNSGRHRVEWMIDALTHDSQEIRHAAGEELKQTTREYFGYYDDLPRPERARAQQRYREWWEARGRAIFAPGHT